MDNLLTKHCVPCEGGMPPLTNAQEDELISQTPNWEIIREGTHQLNREFVLKNFTQAIGLINKIGELAEAENHHPNLYLHAYKKLRVELWTHAIGGLSENDFIMAAKIEQLYKNNYTG